MKEFKRNLVTCALPYANGPVHIGHLAGVYVPADIYVRYLRLRGKDVKFICGSDEHGVPITIKAKKEGISPQQVVDKYHNIIKKAFADFGIGFDIYSRTSSKVHHETSSAFFKKLYDEGKFIQKKSEQLYDPEAKQFLADRYITGTCPHCHNEEAYGDQCEKCGTTLSATDLINPRSVISGAKPEMKKTEHWYLPLNEYSDFLEKWILEEHKEWKSNVYGQCKSWIKDIGLEPRAVTRDLDWGVPVPVEGAEGKVLYVWFDAPIGYISATRELTDQWELYWKDKDTRLIHFIGKDNIVFHCIIFPSMLKAEGTYILPDNVPANEFLNLEGKKISTTKNWAVWLHEYLDDFPGKQDVLRYVLTANMPEAKDNDFTWKDFQARNNNELVADFGNFVNRTLVLSKKYFKNVVQELGEPGEHEKNIFNAIAESQKRIEENIEAFRFRDALKEFIGVAKIGNKYLAETEPWKLIKTDEKRVGQILNLCLQISAKLAALAEPFLPFTSAKLLGFLNLDSIQWEDISKEQLLPAGHVLNKSSLLFEKIEDKQVEKQVNKLLETKKQNEKAELVLSPQKENVSYDDFIKQDIRLGTILEAEKVPKTTKLLKLKIDTGLDQRTIVSGIAEYYKPENIIGKKVLMLVNLEPRKIRGIVSQGMILMAQDMEGKLSFVEPEKDFPNGSVVS